MKYEYGGDYVKKDVAVGLDMGTSSLKVTIIELSNGRVVKNMRVDYKGREAAPGVMAVSTYENTLVDTINKLTQDYSVASIGFSSQMYSMCEETDNGKLIYQWNSLWSRDEESEKNLKKYMDISGCPVDTLYPAYKLFTSKDKNKKFLPYGLKEHIIKFLTGNLVTDYTCASASGFMDIYNMTWNKKLLEAMGYSVKQMPEIKKYNNIAGYMNAPGISLSGAKIPVVPGLGDGMSASYACNDVSKICANLGTSMAARAFVSKENLRYTDKTWAYVVDENTYIVGGISSNGCSVLNWSEDLSIYKEDDIEVSNSSIMFFPWLHGERTPYWSSNLKGTFTGIEIGTGAKAMSAAIVKGVGFTIANLINLVNQDIDESDMIIVAGGGVHKKDLMDVLAGSISMKIGILHDSDYLASYGAAISAAEAIGINVKKNVEIKEIITPNFRFKDEYTKWLHMGNKLSNLYQ